MHTNTMHSNNVTTIVTTAPDRRQTTTILYGGLEPVYGNYKRGLIMGILTATAFVFWLIAMTTPIGIATYDDVNATSFGNTTNATGTTLMVDPWHACSKPEDGAVSFCRPMGHDDETCARSRDAFRVEQAFLILTGLMLLPLLCLAALDFSHKLDARTPDLPFHLGTHWWMLLFAFITALVSLVAFAVAFAIPRMNPCNNGALVDANDFDWGPSPVFSLLVFICALAMIVIALILRQNATVKSREEMTRPHSPIINPHEPLAVTTNSVVPGPVVIQMNPQNQAIVRPAEPVRTTHAVPV